MWVEIKADVSFIGSEGPFSASAGDIVEVNDRMAAHLINVYGAQVTQPPATTAVELPVSHADKDILDAVKVLVELGDPETFTKDGLPKVSAVRELLPRGAKVTVASVQRAFEALTDDDGD